MRRTLLLCGLLAMLGPIAVRAQFSADYQTNIINGVISNWSGDYIVGSNTFFNLLRVENNGALSNANGYIGYEATASNNSVVVTGSGSVWSNNGILYIGNSGAGNSLVISNGGIVVAQGVAVGNLNGSQGTLTMAGGQLTVSGGTNLLSRLLLGFSANATGTVWMTGGRLTTTNIFALIGFSGVGQMTVSNGLWQAGTVSVGVFRQGTLTIAGGTHSLSTLYVSGSTNNSAVWLTGGQLTGSNTYIAAGGFTSFGEMTVSNGTWAVADANVGFGLGAQGTLTVDGGTVTVGTGLTGLSIGNSANATGTTWLTGGQLTVTNGRTWIGMVGSGRMIVSNGTWLARNVVVARYVAIGGGRLGSGTLTVAGGTSSIYSNLTLGDSQCILSGTVVVVGGTLAVTNPTATAVLEVCSGRLTQTGGMLLVDRLVITNMCGHFVYNGGNLSVGSMVLDPNLDADGDGLPNGWEQSHGLNPLTPNAGDDPDGDGFSNLQEFQVGTDPTNSVSAFHITALTQESNDIRVTWATGMGKTNALQAASDLSNSFSDVFTVTNTIGNATNYLDLGAATNFPSRFYRVRLVP